MTHLRTWRLPTRVAALALIGAAAFAGGLSAQVAASAAISGHLVEAAGKPLPFTTIWLVPRDTLLRSRGTLTDTAGAFAFERLPPGGYYLRVDRVGFQSEWSDPKPLAAGQHMALAVTSAPAPIALGRIRTSGACRPGADMAADTPLATLWGEARKAAAARRLFDLSYRYGVEVKESLLAPREGYGSAWRGLRRKLVSTPAVARTLAQQGSYAGYGVGMDSTRLVAVREMLDVLTEPFALSHRLCVLSDSHGHRRVRFEPVALDSLRLDVGGNIELNADYSLRRIVFEYRQGPIAFSRGYVEFGDGGLKRAPVRFLSYLLVWVYDAPASRNGKIHMVPGPSRTGRELARAWARYGPFQRDTTPP